MRATGIVANASSAAGVERETFRGISWFSSSLERFSQRLWSRWDPVVLPRPSKPRLSRSVESKGARIMCSAIILKRR
jgi:hypothetical protein